MNQHVKHNSIQHAKQVTLLSAKTPSGEQDITKCHPSTSDRIVDKIVLSYLIPFESPLENNNKYRMGLCQVHAMNFFGESQLQIPTSNHSTVTPGTQYCSKFS